MKHTIMCMSLCLLLTACGSDNNMDNNGTKERKALSTAAEEDSDKEVLHQMPDSDPVNDAYSLWLADGQ